MKLDPPPKREFVITLTESEAASIVWILDRMTPENKETGHGQIAGFLVKMLCK